MVNTCTTRSSANTGPTGITKKFTNIKNTTSTKTTITTVEQKFHPMHSSSLVHHVPNTKPLYQFSTTIHKTSISTLNTSATTQNTQYTSDITNNTHHNISSNIQNTSNKIYNTTYNTYGSNNTSQPISLDSQSYTLNNTPQSTALRLQSYSSTSTMYSTTPGSYSPTPIQPPRYRNNKLMNAGANKPYVKNVSSPCNSNQFRNSSRQIHSKKHYSNSQSPISQYQNCINKYTPIYPSPQSYHPSLSSNNNYRRFSSSLLSSPQSYNISHQSSILWSHMLSAPSNFSSSTHLTPHNTQNILVPPTYPPHTPRQIISAKHFDGRKAPVIKGNPA